ncbi:hypothetical protein HUK80_16055 [Flavobacterium sp. MAH-1]|uniref:Lipoprotein n=1 Tax=Flavobacterium agri TaxID=2743471 RepID=A0A7Y8Y4G1_9FLAO|nr:hypothetical protein [Flavobacterium agri]NUY82420.1 hypothetical protein [Flavobacterium agri]NYA72444.1 hypothetical protein [Flavobacterium agri]
MMKKILLSLVVVGFAACSGSDDESNVELYLTSDGVQKPYFVEASDGPNADGDEAVLVYADRNDEQQLTFDVVSGVSGDNVVDHVEFVPDIATGTVFYPTDVFFSEVTANTETRLKGNFSGNVTDGETEQYIECTFNIKKNTSGN